MTRRREAPTQAAPRARLRDRLRAEEEGNVSIVGAILLPLLFIFILAIVQAGMVYHANNTARAIANTTVQATRLEDGSVEAGQATASSRLQMIGPNLILNPQVAVSRTAETASVTVTGRVQSILPGLRFPIEQTATGPVERWVNP
jgi:Flp pilus assembly protein TadG